MYVILYDNLCMSLEIYLHDQTIEAFPSLNLGHYVVFHTTAPSYYIVRHFAVRLRLILINEEINT